MPDLFNGIETFVSSEDIRKGKRWLLEVSKELETSNFGIVCLTNDNLEAPWILFEAGALSKFIKESSLFTLLAGGLKTSDVDGPLSHFQHTLFEKEDFYKLCKAVDESNGALKREEARLRKLFDMLWNDLQQKVNNALKIDAKPEKRRSSDEMLREILDVVTSMAKNMPQQAAILEEVKKRYGMSLFPEPEQEWRSPIDANTLNWVLEQLPDKYPELTELAKNASFGISRDRKTLKVTFPTAAGRDDFIRQDGDNKIMSIVEMLSPEIRPFTRIAIGVKGV